MVRFFALSLFIFAFASCAEEPLVEKEESTLEFSKRLFEVISSKDINDFSDNILPSQQWVDKYLSLHPEGNEAKLAKKDFIPTIQENSKDWFKLISDKKHKINWLSLEIDSLNQQIRRLPLANPGSETEEHIREGSHTWYFKNKLGENCFLSFSEMAKAGEGRWRILAEPKCRCLPLDIYLQMFS